MRSRSLTVALSFITAAVSFAVGGGSSLAAERGASSLAGRASLRAADGPYESSAGGAAASPAADEGSRGGRRGDGLFGPLRLGPVVGVSFPRPVSVALLGTLGRTVGVGVEYSALPTITVDDVSVHAWAVSGEGRYYVAATPFFVGAAAGYQALSGSAMFQGVPGEGEATTVFVTPRVGLFWTTQAGFSLGCDVGVQLPVSSSLTVNPSFATEVVASNDVLTTLTKRPLPEVHLVRLGWLF